MYIPQLLGVVLLVAIYLAGAATAQAMDSSIPGSVYGLIACAACMALSPALRKHMRPGALVLLGLIPLFLVPILVRMAVRIDFAASDTWRAIVMLTLASLLGIAVTGLLARLLLGRGNTE